MRDVRRECTPISTSCESGGEGKVRKDSRSRPPPKPSFKQRLRALHKRWRSSIPGPFRRVIVLVLGFGFLLIGLAISPLPGPGFTILAPLGLGILATEFIWARRLSRQVLQGADSARIVINSAATRTPIWAIAPILALYWTGAWGITQLDLIPQALIWSAAAFAFTPLMYFTWCTLRRPRATTATIPGPTTAPGSGDASPRKAA